MSIPKVIHYCWFGRKPLSALTQKCINSWKKYCPNYKIIEWNEENFDININKYVKQSYYAQKYAFVSDFARFYILYNYGGIYMDTDVELLKPIDKFLKNSAFMGFENETGVAPGLIIGSEKANIIIKEIMTSYFNREFIYSNGKYNLTTVVEYTTNILLKYGLKLNNSLQKINTVTIYPKTYFCPLTYNSDKTDFTNNTYAIHYFSGSWVSKTSKLKSKIIMILGPKITNQIRIWKNNLKMFVKDENK